MHEQALHHSRLRRSESEVKVTCKEALVHIAAGKKCEELGIA
jgi:hypothetical protein